MGLHKSRLNSFIMSAKKITKELFGNEMSNEVLPGIKWRTFLHSLDHYSFGKTLDPLDMCNQNSIPEMRKLAIFTEFGFVHDLPFLRKQYKLSHALNERFMELHSKLLKVDEEYANNIDVAIAK